jgi:hypothetical protein
MLAILRPVNLNSACHHTVVNVGSFVQMDDRNSAIDPRWAVFADLPITCARELADSLPSRGFERGLGTLAP